MNTPQNKKPAPVRVNDSLVEQMRELSRGVGKTITQDLVGGVANDALASLFGMSKPQKNGGDLQPGQSVQLGQQPQPQSPDAAGRMPHPERFPFPFRRREQFKPSFNPEVMARLRQQEQQVNQKIEEIRIEIKQLISEIKTVDKEIQKTVAAEFVDPGEYHLNFLDRLKAVLKLMLKEMHQSNTWLNTHKSRKKQMGYWNQYKKKGTTFGLSHERVVATQVG